MNEEQKKRARELIKNTDHAIGLGIMKQLLQELLDAPEAIRAMNEKGTA